MTDKDNILIEDFFKQAAAQQIEDHGFTKRVMESLPDRNAERARQLSRLWTWLCVVLGVVLFFAFGGGQFLTDIIVSALGMLLSTLEVMVLTTPTTEIPVNPWVLVLVLAFVGIYLPYQTYRRLSAIL